MSKKVGLAKLAKARSLSNDINKLGLQDNQEEFQNGSNDEEGIVAGFASTHVLKEVQSISSISEEPPVPMEKTKPWVIGSDSDEVISNIEDASSSEETDDDRELHDLPLSESNPDELEGKVQKQTDVQGTAKNTPKEPKGFSMKLFDSLHRHTSRRKKNKDNTGSESLSSSPNDKRLNVPKAVTRTRSLSRIPDAFSKVHNICVLPAKGARAPETSPMKSSSWYTFEHPSTFLSDEVSSEEFDSFPQAEELDDLIPHRSSSLSNLSDGVSPLSNVKSSDAKHKGNYLFGGLGSLLGPTELDRYFPDRNIVLFIATWNMNGKEPPHSLDEFLLPDKMEHLPDIYVIGTQESGGDRNEWEFLKKAFTA